jgi:hypothetical protein
MPARGEDTLVAPGPSLEDHMRKTLLFAALAVLAACGGNDEQGSPDAEVGDIDAADQVPTCADYCATIEANCAAPQDQWSSAATCMTACASWDVGTIDDTSGNTLGCRNYHAGAAESMPAVHCVHAGPGGAGACGSNCEGFCTLALDACTGANEQFASMAECMTACAGYDATEPYDVTDTGGDTFACRLYHLTAAVGDPGTHCDHIVEASAPCS